MRIAVVLGALCACANLPPVADKVCGNGVVEPDVGEDCDSDAPNCVHCAFACATTADCPAGYACGVDLTCHAPTGVFRAEQTSQFAFPVVGGFAADANGDGIPDVVGISAASFVITYGARDAVLAQQTTQVTPAHDQLAAAERSLAGNAAQILLGTPDGIAGFTAQSQQLLPFPFGNSLADVCQTGSIPGDVTPVGAFAFDGYRINVLGRDASGLVGFGVIDLSTGSCAYQSACSLPYQIGLTSDAYVTTTTPAAASEVVAIDVGTKVCALSYANGAISQLLAVDSGGIPAMLARLPMSAAPQCPALVTGGTSLRANLGTTDAAGACTLAATQTSFGVTVSPPALIALTGRVALVPALGGYGPDALIVTTNVGFQGQSTISAVPATGLLRTLYSSSAALRFASSADMDGDGTVDAVVASAFDIEVLRRLPPGSTAEAEFSPYRIPTTGSPTQLLVSDLDADGHPDIAFAQSAGAASSVEVAWGSSTVPLPPVDVTDPTDLRALIPIEIPDSNDLLDVVPDLAVLAGGDAASALTVLHGGPQRTLPAFYDPRQSLMMATQSRFESLAIGHFVQSDQDVMAFEFSEAAKPRVWTIAGADDGTLGAATPTQNCDLSCDSSMVTCAGVGFCGDRASYTAWSLGDRDVAIGIDDEGTIGTIDPANPSTVATCTTCKESLPSRHAFALGPPGKQLLYSSFAGGAAGSATSPPSIQACTVDASGVVQSCSDVGAQLGLTGCTDMQTGALFPTGTGEPAAAPTWLGEFLALCSGTVYEVTWDSAAGYTAKQVLALADSQLMVLADVDGDQLPDLLLLDFDPATGLATMHIYPQCEARDAPCRAHGAPAP